MAVYKLGDDVPRIPASAYVADAATVIGKVTLGERSSVWPGAVIRADNDTIRIGHDTNIQDGAVLHTDQGFPMVLEDKVTIGHQAMLHGCTVGEGSLIGIQAVLMNNVRIGKYCLVGAGAIVTEGKEFPDRSLIIGAPARAIRSLTDDDLAKMDGNAEGYAQRQAMYKAKLTRID